MKKLTRRGHGALGGFYFQVPVHPDPGDIGLLFCGAAFTEAKSCFALVKILITKRADRTNFLNTDILTSISLGNKMGRHVQFTDTPIKVQTTKINFTFL
jgi:hypothetical protein